MGSITNISAGNKFSYYQFLHNQTGIWKLTVLIIFFLFNSLAGQSKPSLFTNSTGRIPASSRTVLFEQMYSPGTNSIVSQNFETANDVYDSFAADDFAFLDDTWSIGSIEVAGIYYNGSGPASSVNVWIYSSDGSGGLPQNILYSALNVVPTAGLADGSFTIDLPTAVVLTEGWYWLCVQANMDYASGQWGWTGSITPSFAESAWMNPGGGFATPCTPSWGYRVTDCGVGTEPDQCFRILGDIIPVELTSFYSENVPGGVQLNWTTATETNNKGFIVERNQSDRTPSEKTEVRSQNWIAVGFVDGYGTSSEVHNYNFIDRNPEAGKYLYRLKQIDFDGTYKYSKVIEAEVSAPLKFALGQNYPNPFNPATSISYSVPIKSFVSLEIFNALGQKVKTLISGEKEAGSYTVNFNAENLPSGMYLYKLNTGNYSKTRKMLLLK